MKRLIGVLIALLMVWTASVAGFAAALARISDILPDAWEEPQQMAEEFAYLDGEPVGSLESIAFSPGQELRIYLHAGMFADEDGKAVGAEDEGITLSQLRGSNIAIVEEIYQGADAIEEVSLDYERNTVDLGILPGTAYIKVRIADLPKEQELDLLIALKVKGTLRSETEIRISGMLESEVVYIDSDDGYIDIQNGEVLQAQDAIVDCQLDLGSGVIITASLRQGQRYSGAVVAWADGEELVYQLSQSNLEDGFVSFQLDGLYDVYNEMGDYLGAATDKLPVMDAYHLVPQIEE